MISCTVQYIFCYVIYSRTEYSSFSEHIFIHRKENLLQLSSNWFWYFFCISVYGPQYRVCCSRLALNCNYTLPCSQEASRSLRLRPAGVLRMLVFPSFSQQSAQCLSGTGLPGSPSPYLTKRIPFSLLQGFLDWLLSTLSQWPSEPVSGWICW